MTNSPALSPQQLSATPILIIATMQGFGLYALHKGIELAIWPMTDPRLRISFYMLAWFTPIAAMLSPREWSDRFWRAGVTVTSIVVALCAYYVMSILAPSTMDETIKSNSYESGIFYAFAAGLIWFIALPFAQAAAYRTEKGYPATFNYSTLFSLSWQNTLRLFEANVFTLLFWLLLWLGAGLFKLIKINFVQDLITQPIFIYPVTALCYGYALYLLHTRDNIVAVLRKHLLTVFQWLLPFAALLAVAFLFTLMFTGMEQLWRTRYAATLISILLIFLIVLYNAAYGDGMDAPTYPASLRKLLRYAVLAMPLFAGIGLYALALRIEQHGLSVDRILGLIGHSILGIYSIGYSCAVFSRQRWLAGMGRVNTAAALVIVLLLVLLATPVLDPMRLSANSQMARLDAGNISAEQFDYKYFRFDLGNHGIEALSDLAADSGRSELIRAKAQAMLKQKNRWQAQENVEISDLKKRLTIYPVSKVLDESFLTFIQAPNEKVASRQTLECVRDPEKNCMVIVVDLNRDGKDEVAFIQAWQSPVYGSSINASGTTTWQQIGQFNFNANDQKFKENLEKSLAHGEIYTKPPTWDNLQIGSNLFSFEPK